MTKTKDTNCPDLIIACCVCVDVTLYHINMDFYYVSNKNKNIFNNLTHTHKRLEFRISNSIARWISSWICYLIIIKDFSVILTGNQDHINYILTIIHVKCSAAGEQLLKLLSSGYYSTPPHMLK